jgi:hypothetical protein
MHCEKNWMKKIKGSTRRGKDDAMLAVLHSHHSHLPLDFTLYFIKFNLESAKGSHRTEHLTAAVLGWNCTQQYPNVLHTALT